MDHVVEFVSRNLDTSSNFVEFRDSQISCISRRTDESLCDTWHEGVVPCGTRGEDTWHMSGSQVSCS